MHLLLLSSLFYAINNLLWKSHLNSKHPIWLIWKRSIFTSFYGLIALIILEIGPNSLFQAYLEAGLLYLLASVLGLTGLICMVMGLKRSSLSELSLFFSAITILSGIGVSLSKSITPEIIIGSSMIVFTYLINQNSFRSFKFSHASLWYSFMSIAFVFSGFITWNLVQTYSPIISVFTQEITVLASLTITKKHWLNNTNSIKSPNNLRIAAFGMVIFLGLFFGLSGLKITDPFILSLTGLFTPLFTALLGVLFLNEKWNFKKVISFSFLLLGIIIISL